MMNSEKTKWHPKRWLGGEAAKKLRRELSASATVQAGDYVATFKFPLVANAPDDAVREALRRIYWRLGSTEENSLFHFFAAVHLAGFRLFTNTTEAAAHLQSAALATSPLNRQFADAFGLNAGVALMLALEPALRNQNQSADGVRKRINQKVSAIARAVREDERGALAKFIDELCARIEKQQLWAAAEKEKRWAVIVAAGKSVAGVNFTLPKIEPYDFPAVWDGANRAFLQNANFDKAALPYAMHQMVSLAAFVAGKCESTDAVKENAIKENEVKAMLLSDNSNYNALSWLFNPKNLRLFAGNAAALREAGVDVGDCPQESLDAIAHIASTLLENPTDYHDFRSLFGGFIASSVSNYWKRLGELKDGLDGIPNDMPTIKSGVAELERQNEKFHGVAEEFSRVFAGVDALDESLTNLVRARDKSERALNALMGKGELVAGETEVQQVEYFNDLYEECRGLVMQLAEMIRKRAGRKKGEYKDAARLLPGCFLPKEKNADDEIEDAAKFLRRKLNRYDGAKVFSCDDINRELREDADQLKRLREARAAHWRKIAAQCQIDIIAGREKIERQRLDERKRKDVGNIEELACRFVLSRMAVTVQRCANMNVRAAGMLLFDERAVFAEKRDGAAFFNSNKGRMYVSPFAAYRHEPLRLGAAFAGDKIRDAVGELIRGFVKWVNQLNECDMQTMRDAAMLEQCVFDLQVSGLQGEVPCALAKPDDALELNLPNGLRAALEKNAVSAGQVARIFNSGYGGQINGLCARLSREEVIVKSRLQYIGDKALYWLPKTGKAWRLPEVVVSGGSALAKGWNLLQAKPELFISGDVTAGIAPERLGDAVKRLFDSTKERKDGEQILMACLREMPHNWHYKVGKNYPQLTPATEENLKPLVDENNLLDGLVEIKSKKASHKTAKNDRKPRDYVRLAGPSRYKGWLDKALLPDAQQRTAFGDTSLIIEEEYQQSLQDGGLRADYRKTRLQAAVVCKSPAIKRRDRFPYASRFIAIDLGERGIGYAVFDAPDSNNAAEVAPQTIGHVAVPVLRHLIKRVDHHRRRKQPRQRFQSNLNTSLQQMREAAIGELAGVLDGLMHHYEAFPVFESTVGGFESGANMLKMVYGSILQLYLFSNVDAHKAKRAKHWMSGAKPPMWEHPFLVRSDGEKLKLHPGVCVSPAYTSQICSQCDKNPADVIRKRKEQNEKIELVTDARGVVSLGADKIYIYGGREAKKKTDNKLPSFGKLAVNRHFADWDELSRHVKDMLRHKPPAKQSKDTGQSSYLSPFVEVQQNLRNWDIAKLHAHCMFRRNGLVFMHADVNAAVNIGRKWWRNKIAKSVNTD